MLIDRNVIYKYDLTDGSEPYFNLELMGVKEPPELGKGQSIILDMSKTHFFKPDDPIGVVLNFANHSLYYMAMWKMDTHIGMIDDEDDIEKFIIQNNLVEEFNDFLIEINSTNIKLSNNGNQLLIVKENGKLPFKTTASRGMILICRLFCWVTRCKDREALIYFDDFDDMFHYRTSELAIKKIIASNKAQCIFVTHNIGLASNDFLRPDCCFIMDNGELNSLASLTDKDIRRGHNLEKMLREGEFDRRVS